MGKRKGRKSDPTETLKICRGGEDEDGNDRVNELEEKSGFFACYLLTSLCPRYKGHTYIGFTVNPRQRIRQHNGEICSGAFRTKKKRPWEMVLCIYGFPTNVSALQFEWAWQHPVESLAVRKAAVAFKSLGGLANKIKLAYTMLTLPTWNNLNLTVNFFSTKYTSHYAHCPPLPKHMRVHIRSMDDLPCYTQGNGDIFDFENDLWNDNDGDDEVDRTRGSYERLEDVTVPVLDPAENQKNNGEETPEKTSTKPSPERAFLSFTTDYYGVASPLVEDGNGEMGTDKDEVGTQICAPSGEVEVIDLFTPSPEYRMCWRRKKRAVSVACPEIIDLTESPICV